MESTLDALSHAAKLLQTKVSKLTKTQNVTIAEWTLLRQIAAGVITQDQMAESLGLDTSTLSRQLKSLSTKELVVKTAVGNDRRQLEYGLTDTGQRALDNVNQEYEAALTTIFTHWPDEEQQQLQIMLNRLTHSLSKTIAN